MNGSLHVVDDVAESFSRLVIDRWTEHSDHFALAFSGGSTARECYCRLAESAASMDWTTVTAWWGDERCVPLDDIDSNFRLVEESLLRHVPPLAAVHPMDSNIADAASHYAVLLASAPPLDLIHLGLGPDGHTASLFPGSDALSAAPGQLVVANIDPTGSNPHARLTFTFEAIRRCRTAVITVSGASKREALRRVIDRDPTAPGTFIDGDDVIWLVDAEAMGA